MAPRLRNDLVAAFTEEDGVTCVEVTDPATAASFRFYDFEYALAQQLNGQPLEAVVAWAAITYGTDLPPDALDAFVEKLAGLGFLVGGTSGAQPAVLVPASGSSGTQPFGDLATTVGPGGQVSPADVPGMEAFAAEIAASIVDDEATSVPVPSGFANAAAPEGLISGDATEYRLKEAASGLWEQGRRGTPAPVVAPPFAPVFAPPGFMGASAPPREPDRLPPGLEVLGGPLPTPVAPLPSSAWPAGMGLDDDEGPSATDLESALAALGESSAPSGETPLGFIAHAVTVDSGGPAPVGALDTGANASPGAGVRAPPLAPSTSPTPMMPSRPVAPTRPVAPSPVAIVAPVAPPSVTAAVAAAASSTAGAVVAPIGGGEVQPGSSLGSGFGGGLGSWAADVEDQIDHPRAERRQPPRPELVVMPPTAPPLAGEPSIAVPLPRRKSSAAIVLLLLAGAASGAVWFLRPGEEEPAAPPVVPSAPTVHVVSPQPTTFYRWFEIAGTVSPGRDDTLTFTRPGKLQDAMPPGTTFAAGETIARLKGVGERELAVNKIRARVAFLEQLRDSSRAQGEAALRQAEAKLAAKRTELATAQTWQAELEIRPKVAGEIAQLLVAKGAFVPVGAPVFHVRAAGPQARFALSADDITKARALGFCRLETIPGSAAPGDGAAPEVAGARPIDCAYATTTAGEARLVVDVGNASGVTPGTQVRLASARYDGVYPVPGSALVREGQEHRLWVATAAHTASHRTVEVAATIDELALVSRGVSVGDAIIVDPPPTLKNGTEINVAR